MVKSSKNVFFKQCLKPLLLFEINQHPQGNDEHHSQHNEITVLIVKLGEYVEIGAINPGNKGERNKDNGKDG